jgi:aryl-alcohol dehydrogenase-like predicted oxidoreductase
MNLDPRITLGATDLVVSPLCLGGNVFGWTAGVEDSYAVMDAYTSLGGNFIDTADAYSAWVPGNVGGESERIIGDWLSARGNRERIVLATKAGKLHADLSVSAAGLRKGLEESLARLKTDYIDLYYPHHDDENVPQEETLATLDEFVREGKVRYIGASNITAERLIRALDIAHRNGLVPFAVLQNEYNLMVREPYESTMAPVLAEHGMDMLPYYSLARGFLTGKYRGGADVDSPRAKGVVPYQDERGEKVLSVLEWLAGERHVTMGEVALAWLLAKPTVAAPIASARNLEQFDGIKGLTVALEPDAVRALDEASAL